MQAKQAAYGEGRVVGNVAAPEEEPRGRAAGEREYADLPIDAGFGQTCRLGQAGFRSITDRHGGAKAHGPAGERAVRDGVSEAGYALVPGQAFGNGVKGAFPCGLSGTFVTGRQDSFLPARGGKGDAVLEPHPAADDALAGRQVHGSGVDRQVKSVFPTHHVQLPQGGMAQIGQFRHVAGIQHPYAGSEVFHHPSRRSRLVKTASMAPRSRGAPSSPVSSSRQNRHGRRHRGVPPAYTSPPHGAVAPEKSV